MHVFISHDKSDQEAITPLCADLERLGHRVWFDRTARGGQDWWDDVLAHVRDCMTFVFALSPDSVRSKVCLAELAYAEALRRPILPVVLRRAHPAEIPDVLAEHAVDYTVRTAHAAIALHKAFNALPPARPLPLALPDEPEIPTTHRSVRLRRAEYREYAADQHTALVRRLSDGLHDPQERADVWDLLIQLRGKPGLTREIAADIERVLAPSWQPDPQGRFDARYWDGRTWTSHVLRNGRKETDRGGERPSAPVKIATAEHVTVSRRPRRRLKASWVAGAGVLAAAAVGGWLYVNQGPDAEDANAVARGFVDAVNARDEPGLQRLVCARDLAEKRHLYVSFIDSGHVTLAGVNVAGNDPTFTVLAARTIGNSSVTLTVSLTDENGEWRVCDIDKALAGR